MKAGQGVGLDTPLGLMGATGNARGAHLHLELHQGAYQYPRGYKPQAAPWLLDPLVWIANHLQTDELVQDLTVSVKGQPVVVKSIKVGGSNYVLLRDVPKLVPPMSVSYDAAQGLARID